MLIPVTVLVLFFGLGWNLNDKFQEGFVWEVLNRPLNYEDMNRAIWLIGSSLTAILVAVYTYPVLKSLKTWATRNNIKILTWGITKLGIK